MQTPAEACPACGVIFAKYNSASLDARPRTMSGSIPSAMPMQRCQICGATGKTAEVHFRQNVGMLFARRMSSVQGSLCRNCISDRFWKMTLTTLAVGWLGMISLIIAPIFIIMNIVSFARSRSALT